MRPTLPTTLLMLFGIPISALPVVFGAQYWVYWYSYLALVLVLVGIDAVLASPRRKIHWQLKAPSSMHIGCGATLGGELRFDGRSTPAKVNLLIECSELLKKPEATELSPNSLGQVSFSMELSACRRGMAQITDTWINWQGPLGLMQCVRHISEDISISVVPDIQSVRSAALEFFGNREFMAGIKLEDYSGDGSEFDRLREFVPGLDHRSIDWKASARHNKLLSREFRAERNHQIIIALDSGRLMSEPIGHIPKLDHAINSGLLLSWYSLRAGDRVGLFGFDKEANLYRKPQGGAGAFPALHMATAKLKYSHEETNFTLGLAQLASRLHQRSLIILMTDFVDTIGARLMEENLKRLSRKHLVLFVAMRNPELEKLANENPSTVRNMARSVVAADILQEREKVLIGLRRFGIQTIDADPGDVSPELLNRYLEIKRRELIA